MPLLRQVEKLPGVPVAPAEQKAIVDRIRLVNIASLHRYERTDATKVDQISESLRSTGVLINPIIVDHERQILIDGHHRAEAFESLGLRRIPAFTVDYLSSDLTVKNWSHATNADREDVERAIERIAGRPEGRSRLIVGDARNHTMARHGFENSKESAEQLHRFALTLQEKGYTVGPQSETDALRRGLIHSYIEPVVDKLEVIEMIENGELFPREINRHLVPDRPLNVRIPLGVAEDEDAFRRHLHDGCRQNPAPLGIGPGYRQGERLYEEPVTIFRQPARS